MEVDRLESFARESRWQAVRQPVVAESAEMKDIAARTEVARLQINDLRGRVAGMHGEGVRRMSVSEESQVEIGDPQLAVVAALEFARVEVHPEEALPVQLAQHVGDLAREVKQPAQVRHGGHGSRRQPRTVDGG